MSHSSCLKPTRIFAAGLERREESLEVLKRDKELGIVFGKPGTGKLNTTLHHMGYCDANYAEDRATKSTSGYAFMLAGGSISWKSKKQTSISLSTTEAEYYA